LTVERLDGVVPKKNILVLTNSQQEAMVRKLLPDLPTENVIAEPEKRDTAPAIAVGVGWIAGARSAGHHDGSARRPSDQGHRRVSKGADRGKPDR